jgi:ubiquitin carboxyl-terminal hydrolase L3
MPARTYSKTFVPLESNPQIFTSLAHNLGASPGLKFTEFYSLDEDDSEPKKGEILAYILAFPTGENYEDERAAEGEKDVDGKEREEEQGDKNMIWLRQTIHNACGLYALLHAVCNGKARKLIS